MCLVCLFVWVSLFEGCIVFSLCIRLGCFHHWVRVFVFVSVVCFSIFLLWLRLLLCFVVNVVVFFL